MAHEMSSSRAQHPLGRRLRRLAQRIEDNEALDRAAELLDARTSALATNATSARILKGQWLGHAFHPLATDFPLGTWLSASLIDLFGGERAHREAEGLIAFGLVMALPTAAAGLADWHDADAAARRVGVAHAALNSLVMALYASSLIARRRGSRRAGVVLAIAGGVVANASGYLGGHLSFVRAMGVERAMPAG